ncbi:hypothetical protein FNF29_00750 [Cafeteria roenbergensis]|uniref:AAA+ ATPase domain-containing protein n=1 Tax=Cafeteria roenbergensis TaxID=33653 RepID=A0A5A8CV79_CAFRO|nr:hypothetical protein FNF29_00750 [Cafeteria roenbergensis]|eukprot:KAA0156639.1 hypothetical protein FNF29_00750 [Cafeteria roenbergensis]
MDGDDSDADRYAEEEAMLAQEIAAAEAEEEALGRRPRNPKRLLAVVPDSSQPLARSLTFPSLTSSSGSVPQSPERTSKRARLAEQDGSDEEAGLSSPAATDRDPPAPRRSRFLLDAPEASQLTLPVVLPVSGQYKFMALSADSAGPKTQAERANAAATATAAMHDREAIGVLLHCVEAARRREAREASLRADREAREGPRAGPAGDVPTEKWTDQYAPRTFVELLSAEQINRNVLRWVKLWGAYHDRVAEQRQLAGPRRQLGASALGKAKRGGGSALLGSSSRKGRGKDSAGDGAVSAAGAIVGRGGVKEETIEKRQQLRDAFGFGWNIDARVLLLVGPAGVGKTMLAHIAARQAGLQVLELNASDDRSAGRLKPRLQAAMQMRSLSSGGKRRLVVLDEVDGLDSGAVDLLVKMIRATPPIVPTVYPWSGGAGGTDRERRRRRKQGSIAFTCPVICTCNELYAPALRKLREHCQIIEMRRPSQERLSGLLRTICREQDMIPTQEGIAALSERCGYDIRACINTLQTVPLRHRTPAATAAGVLRLTPELVQRLPVGSKDDARSAFDVWSSVLSGHQAKRSAARARRGGFRTGDVAEAASAFAAVAAAADEVRAREAGGAAAVAAAAAAVAESPADDALALPSTALNMSSITAALRAGAGLAGASSSSAAAATGFAARPSSGAGAADAQGAWPRRGPQSFTRFLLEDLSSRGVDVQLLLDGLHENFPSSPHTDPTLQDTARTADWISVGDMFTHAARSKQQFSLNRYAAVCGAGVHWNSASDRAGHKLRPRWPAQRRRLKMDTQAQQEIIATFLGGRMATGAGLGARSERTLVLDVLSPLLTLVAPPLRERHTGLLDSRERRDMADAVAIMATSGLVYGRERPPMGGKSGGGTGAAGADATGAQGAGRWGADADEEDARRLVLKPPIDSLVRFDGYDPFDRGHRRDMPETMKELLSQEVRLAGVRLRAARAERQERKQRRRDERRAAAAARAAASEAAAARGEAPAAAADAASGRGSGNAMAVLLQSGGEGASAGAVSGRRAGQPGDSDSGSDSDSGASTDDEGGPLAIATMIQEALSGPRRRRKAPQLGSGKDVHLPEHVRKQIAEASGAAPVDKASPVKAVVSAAVAKAAAAQGFLGKLRERRAEQKGSRVAPRARFPVYFKFQEGFTDAVRRPVTLEELLG